MASSTKNLVEGNWQIGLDEQSSEADGSRRLKGLWQPDACRAAS